MTIKNLLLIFLLLLLVNCSKENKDYVIISGKIKGNNIDSLKLYDKDYNPIQTIYLSKELTFGDTLFIPKGYYYLGDFKTSTKLLFLKPSLNLNLYVMSDDEDFSISFDEKGSNENIFLQKKIQFNKRFKKVEDYKYLLKLNEENFLKLVDSINTEKVGFLNSQKNIDTDFLLYESLSLETDRASLLESYIKWHGEIINDPDFKVSNNYPNPYEAIDISNEKLLIHPSYLNAISGWLRYSRENKYEELELLSFLETIEKRISSQKIIDELAYSTTEFILQGNNKISVSEYSKFMSIVKNENYKKEIEEAFLKRQNISEGSTSPPFEFYDINNNLITLESLKGKLVYIDIWATWCVPCIQEIPALKLIEEEYKNEDIYFVSMCFKDSEENFKKMVKEKELGGIQLFTPDPNNSFFNEYFLSKIPRFILIDREGKIIDAYAYKPSDPKLKEQLLKHI